MTKQLSSASSKLHPHPLTDIGSGDYIYTKERGKKAKVTTYRHNNKNKKKQYIHTHTSTHTHTHTHIYTHTYQDLYSIDPKEILFILVPFTWYTWFYIDAHFITIN